jgi:membrane-bound lytic murein transglycosylase MltF
MISNHIEDLERITRELKTEPNSPNRNKALSHGLDMLAHLQVMKMGKYPTENLEGLTRPYNASNYVENVLGHPVRSFQKEFMNNFPVGDCNCPEGARSIDCSVHGNQR